MSQELTAILDALVIPVVLFGLGAWLPRRLEGRKREAFVALIRREVSEMGPKAEHGTDQQWHKHLTKRFIHEEIFKNPSENRDFILSLAPDLAYNEAQFWTEYEKAKSSTDKSDLAAHGKSWCDYLKTICRLLDRTDSGPLHKEIYKPWKNLIKTYHPGVFKESAKTAAAGRPH